LSNRLSHSRQDNDHRKKSILAQYRNNPLHLVNWLNTRGWPAKQNFAEVVCNNMAREDNNPSISINMAKLQWLDRGNPAYRGDLFGLFGLVLGIDPRTEFPQLLDALDSSYSPPPPIPAPRLEAVKKAVDFPLVPFPRGCEPPMQPDEVSRWHYRDENSLMIMSVIKSVGEDGKKQIRPFRWNEEKKKFVQKHMPEPRVLFNLDKIRKNPTATILVVEGEKCAEYAERILPAGWIVTTWSSGASSVSKTEWEPLAGRTVIVWPDADEPGRAAGSKIGKILPKAIVLAVPGIDGEDIADAINDGMDTESFVDFVATHKPKPAIDLATKTVYDYPDVKYRKNGDIILPGTLANVEHLCRVFNRKIRWNIQTKNIEMGDETDATEIFKTIYDHADMEGVGTKTIVEAIEIIAKKNKYHPFCEFVLSKPWDGIDRLGDLYSTMMVPQEYERMKQVYLRKFLIATVTSAFSSDGLMIKAILTLQGPQHLGKSTWFNNLLPKDSFLGGFVGNFREKDDKLRILKHLVVELGELEGTFNRSHIAEVKAFTGTTKDEIRMPYGRASMTIPRQTVLVASVNQENFLADKTGNVRFWVLPVERLDYEAVLEIDRQQLFAQVYAESYGQNWWLSDEELAIQAVQVENFEILDPITAKLEDSFDFSKDHCKKMSTIEILNVLRIDRPTRSDMMNLGTSMKKLGVRKIQVGPSRIKGYLMPPEM